MSNNFFACVLPKGGETKSTKKKVLSAPFYWFSLDETKGGATLIKDKAQELLCDSVDEEFVFGDFSPSALSELQTKLQGLGYEQVALRQLKAGVTDNTANSVKQALSIMGLEGKSTPAVSAGAIFLSEGAKLDVPHNALIERVFHFQLTGEKSVELPQFPLRKDSKDIEAPEVVDVQLSDEELVKLSKDRLLSLSLEEMQAVKAHFADAALAQSRKAHGLSANPTDVELEIIAQTWSEHCKHKIFNATIEHVEIGVDGNESRETVKSLYKSYIKALTAKLKEKRKDLLSVFEDNAGVVDFDEQYAVCFKVETHNSPSALEPYGGALTGILGVNRDILGTGLGAKPIFNTDVFCFAHPQSKFVRELKHAKLTDAADIITGVRKGVQDGGNKSGIPTVNGAVFFDDSYRAKPLVYCGTGGLLPKVVGPNKIDGVKKHTKKGDYIVMSGGRVGKDGVHGATFSSLALDDSVGSDVVQIGDPFTQKRLLDFVMAARDAGLLTGLTDNGAGGLSSSVGEMANITGGATIELSSVPLKYPGLADWQIVVSESQERMTFSTDNAEALLALSKRYDVESTVIGQFNDEGYFHVTREGKTVALLSLAFLHDGAPVLKLESKWQWPSKQSGKGTSSGSKKVPEIADAGATLSALLSHANVSSRQSVIRQYDHEVQGGSVIKPLMGVKQNGPTDAGVLYPHLESKKAIAVSCGMAPLLSQFDPYLMAQCSVDEAVRNAVCVGADPDTFSLLDNFCWPDPVQSNRNDKGREKLAQLVLACKGLYDICLTYGAPLISGKDSMKNDFDDGQLRLSIAPTLLVSALAIVPEPEQAQSSDFKNSGDLIYLLRAGTLGLAASVLSSIDEGVAAEAGNYLPTLDRAGAIDMYRKLYQAIKAGLVRSAHDVSDGGLAVALAESCLGGQLGADIELGKDALTLALFGEGPANILVSVAAKDKAKFGEVVNGCASKYLGTVGGDKLKISATDKVLIDMPLEAIDKAFHSVLPFDNCEVLNG